MLNKPSAPARRLQSGHHDTSVTTPRRPVLTLYVRSQVARHDGPPQNGKRCTPSLCQVVSSPTGVGAARGGLQMVWVSSEIAKNSAGSSRRERGGDMPCWRRPLPPRRRQWPLTGLLVRCQATTKLHWLAHARIQATDLRCLHSSEMSWPNAYTPHPPPPPPPPPAGPYNRHAVQQYHVDRRAACLNHIHSGCRHILFSRTGMCQSCAP